MTTASDIAKRLDGVSQHGTYYRAFCPMHGETEGSKPSLLIRDNGAYCLSPRCAWHHRTRLESVEKFLDRLGKFSGSRLSVEQFAWPVREHWQTFCDDAAKQAVSRSDVRNYLASRRISFSTMLRAHIGYTAGKLVFPCRERDDVYSFILRDLGEPNLYRVPPKSVNTIYNPAQVNSSWFYLTFGIFDALSYTELGYPALSTLRNWTNLDVLVAQLEELDAYLIIVPDAGEEAQAEKLRKRLPNWKSEVFVPNWRQGIKDANGWHVRYGQHSFRRNLTHAIMARGL